MRTERGNALIAVYIITYRRHDMLRRAIASVLNQTHRNIVVKVVNDDPTDSAVLEIVRGFDDRRISLFMPVEKRGGNRNFNLAFQEASAEYVSILEDDNWWEPNFLQEQLRVLGAHPDAPLVVSNERLWRELPQGGWKDTERTIWPFTDVRFHEIRVEDICGSAKICNSSMLIRAGNCSTLLTPNTIPVDVTEHFRERLLPWRLLLNGAPLVNFAQTMNTARSVGEDIWGSYQCLLIASVFVAFGGSNNRASLALRLWKDCPSNFSPRAVSLLAAGLAFREARVIVWRAPFLAILRFFVWVARRPTRLAWLMTTKSRLSGELAFLVDAPLTQHFAEVGMDD
jgi:glycosyltransferase involved in cell wall biosynthesis